MAIALTVYAGWIEAQLMKVLLEVFLYVGVGITIILWGLYERRFTRYLNLIAEMESGLLIQLYFQLKEKNM